MYLNAIPEPGLFSVVSIKRADRRFLLCVSVVRYRFPSVEKVLLSLSFFHCGNVVFYFLQSSYFVPFFCDEFITCAKL